MKSRLTISIGLSLLLLICQALQAQKKNKNSGVTVIEKYNPQFSYTPQKRDAVASAGLTIALLDPVFIGRDIERAGSPWSDFSKAMANDVEELLTAKGFKVRGPFNSIDEMVYSDKQNSDFIIQINILMDFKADRKWKQNVALLTSGYNYRLEKGDVSLNSTVNLTALSCFTSEKLWKKDLPVPQKNFTYVGSLKWPNTMPTIYAEFQQEPNLWNPTCKNLEDIYKESFDILYKQFDVMEMKDVAKAAKSADKARKN